MAISQCIWIIYKMQTQTFFFQKCLRPIFKFYVSSKLVSFFYKLLIGQQPTFLKCIVIFLWSNLLVNFVQGAPVTVAPLQGSICTNPGKKICGFKTVPICEDQAQMHGVVWKSYWVQLLKLVMCWRWPFNTSEYAYIFCSANGKSRRTFWDWLQIW